MFVKTVCECQKTYYARAKGLINVKLKIENGKLKMENECREDSLFVKQISVPTVFQTGTH